MSERYEPVIGLEVHVQLKTRTKIFSPSENRYGAPPNTLTDPVVLGMPGVLPVANKEAFRLAIRAGLALGGEIATYTRFDRKQYFYPDLPKGYQISQLEHPVVSGGGLDLPSGRRIGIVRAHLEEDAGKTLHAEGSPSTLVDLNRCGVPLLEIVSGPDLRSPAEAVEYLTALKLLLRHIDVSDCDMEKGSLRCDVNVSIRPKGTEPFGTRTEIKNLNSFKAVERGLEHEIARHARILDAGGELVQDTRLWDDERGESRLMRTKEESSDYRYFPDPDLPPHQISRDWIEEIRSTLPELPAARARRYQEELGLSAYDTGVLVQDREVCAFFDEAVELCGDPKAVANWIMVELFGLMKAANHAISDTNITPRGLATVIRLVQEGRINAAGGKTILGAMYGTGKDPEALVEELGLAQLSDQDALVAAVKRAMEANPKAVADMKAGRKKAAGAILGHVMRETKGRANPGMVNRILEDLTS